MDQNAAGTQQQTITVQDRPKGRFNLHSTDIVAISSFIVAAATVITGPILADLLGQFGVPPANQTHIVTDFATLVGFAGLVVRLFGNKSGTNKEVTVTPPDTIIKEPKS